MRTNSWPNIFLIQAAAFALALCAPRAASQTGLAAKRDLVWSQAGTEIRTPAFSPDGQLVVFVTRPYWPDGHEAEDLPESFFKSLEAKAKADPRFADPVIQVVDLTGKTVCETRYGWHPQVSPDNRRVLYTEQVKPITGFRELAESFAGNGIRTFDCESKQTSRTADPEEGYLDTPFFSPDGRTILYTLNEAVNGAFGGAVGLARFDPQENRSAPLLKKKTVAAVPCPPAGSAQSDRLAFLCSQGPNLTRNFSRLVFQAGPAGSGAVALVRMPIPAPGDMYLAGQYELSLISLLPEEKVILHLGKQGLASGSDISFQAVQGERFLVHLDYWKLYLLATGEALADVGPKNTNPKSIYSPDLRFYLVAEGAKPDDEPDHFVLYRTADGKRIERFRRMAQVYEAVWSPDGKRFAMIGVPLEGANPRRHVEELVIYSVP